MHTEFEASHRTARRRGEGFELLVLGLLVAATALLAWFSPSEQTIGAAVKLVYVHGAVVWASLVMFAFGGLLGVMGLVGKGRRATRYAFAAAESAVAFWLIHVLLSIVVTWWSWGGIYWQEPRFQMAFVVLAVSAILFPAILLFRSMLTTNLLAVALSVVVFGLLVTSGKIMHPANPIGSSDALSVKVFFSAIVVVVVAMSVQYTRLVYRSRRAGWMANRPGRPRA